MAAKKKAPAKRKALAKPKAQLPTNYKEKLAAIKDKQKGLQAVDSNYLRAGIEGFEWQGENVGSEMDVVIVDSVFVHSYYDKAYNADDDKSSPACAAVADTEDALIPFADSPNKQAESCADCPNNVFGSHENGSGKACGNRMKLLLIPFTKQSEIAPDSELAVFQVPTTSMKACRKLIKQIDAVYDMPSFGVAARITCSVDAKTQYRLDFEILEEITEESALASLIQIHEDNQPTLRQKPDFSQYEAPTGSRKRPAAKKKAAAKRSAAKKKTAPKSRKFK